MYLVRSGAIEGYEKLVRQFDLKPNQLLNQVGLTSAQLKQPNTYISYLKLANLLDYTAEACQHPTFSLQLGIEQGVMAVGEWVLSIPQQPTVLDAILFADQHVHIHAHGAHVSLQAKSSRLSQKAEVHFTHDFTNSDHIWQLKQLSVMQGFNVLKFLTGKDNTDIQIHFKHSLPNKIQALNHQQFGLLKQNIIFGSHFDGLAFPIQWLNDKPSNDQSLIQEYFQHRIRLLEALYPNNLQEQTRHIISHLLASGECSIHAVSAALNFHPRTFQKRLKAEGIRFSELLQTVRLEIAEQHLKDSNISITDLALNLGYAEVAIFSRNFKKWTGCTPLQWRKLQN
ncbi:helix-turn-helix transcriptional regulator [Vibrio rumoiensis]|uniref:HTH araC/xylS-type domain-containing protein n=1 Tax=Vibrio rumoiensis 1S-45 TaxID=1188252 RepID=A0A1E5E2J8_9VIBR|nr:AraC family transcriptional regulator [Vibrio rumoiensis]OEF25756.1 hypothetical protein A1QC_08290 [Vibrio rumoiensis 1S-45]